MTGINFDLLSLHTLIGRFRLRAAFTSGTYFLRNGRRWQWICEFYTANLKGIFGGPAVRMCLATSNNMPQTHFFSLYELAIFWAEKDRKKDKEKKDAKTFFVHAPSPFPGNCLQLLQWWHLHCFAILGSTFILIHSVKQRLLRNRPGSDAATSRDFLRERLQRAFTRANQLHWTAQ